MKRSIFYSILTDYLCQSQIQGYKFIMQTDRPLYERVLWMIVTIFGILLTFWFVLISYKAYSDSPTVTSEDLVKGSVLDLSFPAVLVCSANRISRLALIKYANVILNFTKDHEDHVGRSVEEIFQNLIRIGQIYNLELSGDDFYKLQSIHNVLTNIHGGPYPIHDILTKLAPSCINLIKRCQWQGQNVLCSKIFTTRKSYMGSCCSFNYYRPGIPRLKAQQEFNDTIPKLNEALKVTNHDSNYGLTIFVDHDLNDYAYTMNSYTGINILIFNPYDYPDQVSGAIHEKIILPEEEVFIELHPILIKGSNSMRSLSIDARNCAFGDEIKLVFPHFYSLSECLLTCRINNIIKFCGCTPPQFSNLYNGTRCLFSDMSCLNRWRLHWFNFEPLSGNTERNSETHEIHCPECVPKCNRIKYSVHMSQSNLNEVEKRIKFSEYINATDIANHSIIYINFGTNAVTSYVQTTQYLWYELLAQFGGVACLSLGATMISIIEIIYFFTGKLGANWVATKQATMLKNSKTNTVKFDYVN